MTTATNLSKAAEDMVAVPSSVNEDKFFGFFSNFGTFMYLSLRRPLSAKEKSMLFHP